MADGLLSVRELAKEYPAPDRPLCVLKNVSFDLNTGEALVIMGPSGSGKSTLLNIISTLDAPTHGAVFFENANVHAFDAQRAALFRNRQIGFVFQDHHLLPQCTAEENVLLPCLASGPVTPEHAVRCGELFVKVGLAGKGGHLPGQLSGGERQRVAVARALMLSPRLLLCDEPTGNLDAENAQAVVSLFVALRDEQRLALLVVTHNAAVAQQLGRCRVLKDGTLHE